MLLLILLLLSDIPCHASQQPVQIYSSRQFGRRATPWSSEEMLFGSSRGHDGRFSRDPLPVFSAGGRWEQFWHERGFPLFDVSKGAGGGPWTRPDVTLVLALFGRRGLGTRPDVTLVLALFGRRGLGTRPDVTLVLALFSRGGLWTRSNVTLVLALFSRRRPWTRQRMDIPAYAKTAHNGLLQKRPEGDLC